MHIAETKCDEAWKLRVVLDCITSQQTLKSSPTNACPTGPSSEVPLYGGATEMLNLSGLNSVINGASGDLLAGPLQDVLRPFMAVALLPIDDSQLM